MKLHCPVCGEKVEAEHNYCMNCNSRLQKCVRCRTVNAAGFSYCHSCGQALQFRREISQYPRQSNHQIRGHIDQTVYSYLVSRGGSISWSQALQELNMSHTELKDSVGRLMNQGLLEPQQTVKQTPKLETVQMPEVEELSTTLDPLTLTVTALMLAAVRDAKKHSEYVKLDRLTSRISEIALGREMPHDASQLDFRDQLKLCTLVFEFVRDKVPYKGEPFGGLIRKPWETIETGGDCDCKVVLVTTMLDNLGFRKLMISVLPPGKYLDSNKNKTVNIEGHTLLEVGLLKDGKDIWVRMDPSCPDCSIDEIPELYLPLISNFYRVPVHYR